MDMRATGRKLQAITTNLAQPMARLFRGPRGSAPKRAEVGGPLDAVNDEFHHNYEVTKGEQQREVPIFVVLADELVVFHRDARVAYSFAPRSFHVIKSVTHAPLSVFATLERLEGKFIDLEMREQLHKQRLRFESALAKLHSDAGELGPQTREDLRTVLQSCVDFLGRTQDSVTDQALHAFASALGPVLLRLADDATQLQLDALHAHVEAALRTLDTNDREQLHVVVAGDHQARARSLAMQYFQKRLGETPEVEDRVTYAEGVCDEKAALALVSTRRLDHALGRAFFGDEHRLQRDILGDAAKARLENIELGPIGRKQ